MSMQEPEAMSWSGLGVGTVRESFLLHVAEQLPSYEPDKAVHAVCSVLFRRLPGGIIQQLLAQFSPDVRELFEPLAKDANAPPDKLDRDEFYRMVANRLNIDTENVRLALHGVFAALHTQITEGESHRVASQLPDYLAGTWMASRRQVDRPS
jgi:uncharacterized protein (DUF2267 family)